MIEAPPVVELRGVGLVYPGPPPVEALYPCDLAVRRGDFITVTGPSGAGKSSLLNLIGLLDKQTSGSYLLNGIDTGALREVERTALRGRFIGFVFQSFHLLPYRNALENVTLALVYQGKKKAERTALAHEALVRVGLEHRISSFPTTLSGGERQRVAIARALVGDPALLLCDEPTGNLDTKTASSILALLEELNASGLTVVVITHDSAVARRGSRMLEIRDGRASEREPA
ncbi:ABC transporter ATP-binding protein [Streptomyces sp. NPDC052051]|uniref:ABC transporter ATP-binding protein n=1 Tax=Streptomyces sp. NPDC052051 TaxID=3154649 RepID=UPI0034299D19